MKVLLYTNRKDNQRKIRKVSDKYIPKDNEIVKDFDGLQEDETFWMYTWDDEQNIILNSELKALKINSGRIQKLQVLLKESNQKAIEFAAGEITAAEFKPIKKQRQQWRDELNKVCV